MTVRATITRTVSVSGMSLVGTSNISSDASKRLSVNLPRGFLGTLTTRTNSHAGQMVLEAGHGLTTSDKVDIYSSVGALLVRDCTISSVVTNLIAYSGTAVSAGIPNSLGLELTCSKQISSDLAISDTSLIVAIAYIVGAAGSIPSGSENAAASVQFKGADSDYDQSGVVPLSTVGLSNVFDISAGEDESPILDMASTTTVVVSNPLRTQRATFQLGCVFNTGS